MYRQNVTNSDVNSTPRAPLNFLLRQNLIETFFLRISQTEKLNLIVKLCETMSAEITYKWNKYINLIIFDKILGYTRLRNKFESTLFDNSRALSKESVESTVMEHVEWFRHLDDEMQFFIYITLLRLGGSGLTRNVCSYMRTKYYSNKETYKFNNISGMTELKALKDCVSSQFLIRTYQEVLDPTDPHMAEVIKKRAAWKTLMDAYRREIEEKVRKLEDRNRLESGGKKDSKGKKEKGKKSGKEKGKKGSKSSDKKNSGKKSSDKKKSGKKGGKSISSKSKKNSESVCLDFIQLMPNNVVKKIFSLLDKKTLAVAAKVNSFWKYTIDSLHEDVKARKMLDKVIEMMKKDLKPIDEVLLTPHSIPLYKNKHFERLNIEGTCSKSVRKALNDFGGEKYNTSLKQSAVQQLPEYYTMPVYNLGTELRKASDESPYEIHWSPKCVKHEAGVKMKKPSNTLEPLGNITILTRMQIVNPQKSYDSVSQYQKESQGSFFFQTTETNENENK